MRKLFIFIFIFTAFYTKASHIVGGNFTYVCLGNNTYEFTLSIYRDCLPPSQGGGNPAALTSDDPAFISIYSGNNFYSFDSIFYTSNFTIPTNFANDCINNPPATCLNRLQFKFIKFLPPSANPYTVVYQRCCRNETINNVINPGTTGASYTCIVPGNNVVCNNSADFVNYPPQIICVNNPFVYDHSAIDADGDSLNYYFCDAFKGGDANDPKPLLIGGLIPFFSSVNYRSPYSPANPMGGNPVLKIDPKTGIISGTPNIQGRFVVNVCCDEWRNGAVINTTKREFQFVVTNCSKAVVANIPQYSDEQNTYIVNCKSYDVHFVNQSTGGFTYLWDFGIPGISTDTSSLFEPNFTYPDTGTYFVKLIVNKGTTCPDSIIRIVKIYPLFTADFDYKGLLCPNTPISFIDQSTSTFGLINYWKWDFDDNLFSTDQNPTHSYENIGKDFNVTLISGNKYGCRDTASEVLKVPKVNVFAGNDTVIVKNSPFQFNGTGAQNYAWSPATYLDNPFVNNPNAVFPDTGSYTYNLQGITSNNCYGYDDINIIVADGPYLTVPNAFSPNGDGNNDFFKILSAGYKKLKTFKIFNRWGEQLFATSNFRESWDGTNGGKPCEIGTYFWIVTAVDVNDNEKLIKGDVILIR
jgi:gliding motility-associated-like protein